MSTTTNSTTTNSTTTTTIAEPTEAQTPITPDPLVPAPATPPIVAPPIAGPPIPATPVETPPGDPAVRSVGLRHGVISRLRADERGEGVISAAIAVLIMAFVGVAAFVAYRGIMGSVTAKTTECVNVYVSNGSGCQ